MGPPLETAEAVLNTPLVGLSVLYLMQGGDALQWCIRQSSDVENMMISVERIQQYVDLAPEAELETEQGLKLKETGWPGKGTITIKRLGVSYRKDNSKLPGAFALRDVSATIPAGTKVALVGRTGSGKSTMLSALFRLVEAEEGTIQIDDVNLKNIGLHEARGAIANIPQTPWLFSGSIRANVDPFHQRSDEDIWNVLDEVQLKSVFDKEGLDFELAEAGGNLSVGERQLVCLARALLSQRSVITLDEATANVDHVTDRLIQDTVRSKFSGKTLIVIAHRLNTIIDSDLVLVLDSGRLVESGTPHELLCRDGSVFSSMCRDTGPANEQRLRAAAASAAGVTE